MSALLSVSEAKHKLLSVFKPLQSETVPLSQAVGRVLSESIRAVFDIPPFDNSSMDGFAVRAADVSTAQSDRGVELAVIADIAAGQMVNVNVEAGQA
ncbi:MAG TPA: hypothetical protein VLD65_09005, partial [Anaerolineales bacterium]|nr:hypothetical protein [Anaerolineales bacterium]